MIWMGFSPFILLITAASVVDLPDPVGPVTRTMPVRLFRDLFQLRWDTELFHRRDPVRDDPQYGTSFSTPA